MALFSSLRRRVETASLEPAAGGETKVVLDQYYRTLAALGGGAGADRPWPIERAVAEGYERVVWVFKSVDTIASNASRLPFILKQGENVITDHPMYRVLNKRANPLETGQQFRERLSAQVLLSRRGAFVEVTKSRAGTVVRYDLLPPGRTIPVPGTGADLLSHFEVTDARTGRRKNIAPERVRWIRKAHPIDPYLAMTPLEAMGMSIELDFFARLYNVNFMRNDGRPGGILGVETDMEEELMDRVEAKFGKGPVEAGKLTVLGGELSYVDVAAKPRDMQYQALAKNAKEEILSGFGVDESVMGLTANRTYDNAEQALYNFWTIVMAPHNEILLAGLDEDTEDELDGEFDTSNIEALELPQRKRREEARQEFEMGLRSIFSYAQVAGITEVEETPDTRSLLLPNNKEKVASTQADYEAEQQKAEEEKAAEAAAQQAQLEAAQAAAEEAPAEDPAAAGGGLTIPETDDPMAILAAVGGKGLPQPKLSLVAGGAGAVSDRAGRRLAVKAAVAAVDDTVTDRPDTQARDRAENALAGALAALATRRVAVTAARVQSPKTRKGTRHWETTDPGDTRAGEQALDAARIVDADRWAAETEAAARPIVTAAAIEAAAATGGALEQAPDDDTVIEQVTPVVAAVLGFLAESARRQATLVAQAIIAADTAGLAITAVVAAVMGRSDDMTRWADGVAIQATTSVTEAARAAVLTAAGAAGVEKEWQTRHDPRVRHSHAAVDGQRQGPNEPFEVGGALLRWPGDPLAPFRETAGCRCTVVWRWRNPLRRTS